MPLTPQGEEELHQPNTARIYDAALGGYAHFAADRAALDALLAVHPDALLGARANRAFLHRAVRFVAQQGVAQFLDVGSGLPTAGNVHEVVRRITPQAPIVYVDNDPVAVRHSQQILTEEHVPDTAAIEADLRAPAAILTHPETRRLLDFSRPIALLLVAVLHFIPDDAEAERVVAALTAALPLGSYLVLSHGTYDGASPETLAQFTRLYQDTTHPVGFRPRATVEPFFDGFELVPPGLVFAPAWRPDGPNDPFVGEPERATSWLAWGGSCSLRNHAITIRDRIVGREAGQASARRSMR